MKKLIALSLTDVNNIEFRNLNEVDRWLKQFDNEFKDSVRRLDAFKTLTASCMKLPVLGVKTYVVAPPVKKKRKGKIDPKTKVVVPRIRELTKNFDLLEDLYRQQDALNVIESKVNQSFADDKALSRIVKDIEKKRRNIERAIKEAKKFIDGLARKQIPKDFYSVGSFVFKRFVADVEDRFDNSERMLYINIFEDDGDSKLQFTDVLHLKNFENGKGYVYPDWYIVITFIANPNETSDMYISTEVEFTVPSREPRTMDSRGNKFRDKQHALKLLVADLEMEGFVDALNEAPVPLEKNDIEKMFQGRDIIKKVNVTETDIEFHLKPKITKQSVEQFVKDVMNDLKTAVRDTDFKRGVRYQLEKRGSATVLLFNFRFPETRKMKEIRVNKTELMEMKRKFDLSEQQTRRLYRLITAPRADDNEE